MRFICTRLQLIVGHGKRQLEAVVLDLQVPTGQVDCCGRARDGCLARIVALERHDGAICRRRTATDCRQVAQVDSVPVAAVHAHVDAVGCLSQLNHLEAIRAIRRSHLTRQLAVAECQAIQQSGRAVDQLARRANVVGQEYRRAGHKVAPKPLLGSVQLI